MLNVGRVPVQIQLARPDEEKALQRLTLRGFSRSGGVNYILSRSG
jgi:hypothetical protein